MRPQGGGKAGPHLIRAGDKETSRPHWTRPRATSSPKVPHPVFLRSFDPMGKWKKAQAVSLWLPERDFNCAANSYKSCILHCIRRKSNKLIGFGLNNTSLQSQLFVVCKIILTRLLHWWLVLTCLGFKRNRTSFSNIFTYWETRTSFEQEMLS